MERLRLGVAREKITPPVGGQLYGYSPDVFSTSVADDLTVTAFWFQQGAVQAVMISATVCEIQTALAQKILLQIEQEHGVSHRHCMLAATHTHSGPNTAGDPGWGELDHAYCEGILIPAILAAVAKARQVLRPVTMRVAEGTSLVGVNRREISESNEIVFGQNTWASFNPTMTVIAFAAEDGTPVANMVHYGAHGTAAGTNHEISRDWSGVMTDALEQESGAITAFFNGPEGDIGPRLSNGLTVGDLRYVHELGAVAARDVLAIYKTLGEPREVALAVSDSVLHIPLKPRMGREEAAAMLTNYIHETVNIGGMIKTHLQEVIASYENGFRDADYKELPQTLVALGNIVFASSPYELFSEIGMRIDKAVSDKTVLSLSLTNGCEGYFITQDAVCRGGYEVGMFLYKHIQPFCDNADYYWMKETVAHIRSMKNESEE